MRKRLFDIIQIGKQDDIPSRAFDIGLVATVFLNIAVTFMLTFEALSEWKNILYGIEAVTLVLFAVEYFLRIITADYLFPGKGKVRASIKFILSFDGIVDLLTILPFNLFLGFIAFRMLRVFRIFNAFKVNRKIDSFHVIVIVIKEKWKQIISSVILIFVFMLASSLGMYAVEHDAQPEVFQNAFSGLWWSMSTLLTIGYGDIYPVTLIGRLLTIVISFLGVGLVAIPTGIISAGFVEQYQYRASVDKKLSDIKEIGEVKIFKDSPYCGKTIEEIHSDGTCQIMLVIRSDMKIVPTPSLKIHERDILILESERIVK